MKLRAPRISPLSFPAYDLMGVGLSLFTGAVALVAAVTLGPKVLIALVYLIFGGMVILVGGYMLILGLIFWKTTVILGGLWYLFLGFVIVAVTSTVLKNLSDRFGGVGWICGAILMALFWAAAYSYCGYLMHFHNTFTVFPNPVAAGAAAHVPKHAAH